MIPVLVRVVTARPFRFPAFRAIIAETADLATQHDRVCDLLLIVQQFASNGLFAGFPAQQKRNIGRP
jgi:hypothetical protein